MKCTRTTDMLSRIPPRHKREVLLPDTETKIVFKLQQVSDSHESAC